MGINKLLRYRNSQTGGLPAQGRRENTIGPPNNKTPYDEKIFFVKQIYPPLCLYLQGYGADKRH